MSEAYMVIYLIRHGQTAWNQDGIFRGQKDIPLNTEGFRQAELAGTYLQNRNIRTIYTSPLKRSLQTASTIAQHTGSSVIVVDTLTDIDFGEWEGKTSEEVASQYSKSYCTYRRSPESAAFPRGETLNDCFERIMKTLHQLLQQSGQADTGNFIKGTAGHTAKERIEPVDIAIVSHRVILKLVVLGVLGLSTASFWKVQLDTCSISEVLIGVNSFVLRQLNSVSHLNGLEERRVDF
jgi:broad specificity phosphatase PhoE